MKKFNSEGWKYPVIPNIKLRTYTQIFYRPPLCNFLRASLISRKKPYGFYCTTAFWPKRFNVR